MTTPFLYELDDYKRDLDVVDNAIETAAKFISLTERCSLDSAYEFAKQHIEANIDDPVLKSYRRELGKDREEKSVPFTRYLNWVSTNDHVLTPNGAAFISPNVFEAPIVEFIKETQARRKVHKKAQIEAGIVGDKATANREFLEQNNCKFFLNSISGSTALESSTLYTATAHPSMTSTCRAVTSYANSVNERLLASNNHFHSPDVTLSTITHLARLAKKDQIAECRRLYGIELPSVEFVYERIKASTDNYWRSDEVHETILALLRGMDEYELAAVGYMGDLQALIDANPDVIRKLYNSILTRPLHPHDTPDEIIKSANEDVALMVGIFSGDFLAGLKVSDLKEQDPRNYGIYAAWIEQTQGILDQYELFFKTYLTTDFMPPSIHSFPTILRKVVIASDTDSSIFTANRQAEWYMAGRVNEDAKMAASALTTFLASQVTVHVLAKLCANMGVVKEDLYRLTMKNEFFFPVMGVTTRTKHYLASIRAKEGGVYKENQMEVKGVNLKSSKLPGKLRALMDDYYLAMINAVDTDQGEFRPKNAIAFPAMVEHKILESFNARQATYYAFETIRPPNQTSDEDTDARYRMFKFWNYVFGDKYGKMEVLPAQCYKVPVELPSRKALRVWAESLEPGMRAGAERYIAEFDPDGISRILVPVEILGQQDMFQEVQDACDIRKLLATQMGPFYMVLECMGIYLKDKWLGTLASDTMTYAEAEAHLTFAVDGLD